MKTRKPARIALALLLAFTMVIVPSGVIAMADDPEEPQFTEQVAEPAADEATPDEEAAPEEEADEAEPGLDAEEADVEEADGEGEEEADAKDAAAVPANEAKDLVPVEGEVFAIPAQYTVTVDMQGVNGLQNVSGKFPEGTNLGEAAYSLVPGPPDGGEHYIARSIGSKPSYSSYEEYSDDSVYSKTVDADTTVYIVWMEMIDSVDVTIAPPICGTVVSAPDYEQSPTPSVTINTTGVTNIPPYYSGEEGASYWFDGIPSDDPDSGWPLLFEGTFQGGKSYVAGFAIFPEFNYFFGSEVSVTVNGKAADKVLYGGGLDYGYGGMAYAFASVACEHDWSEWTVTKEPTTTEPGERTRTCNYCGEVETEEIPPTGEVSYAFTKGNGATWQKGSGTALEFTVSRSIDDDTTFSHFTSLAVDGRTLSDKAYTASSGSLNASLNPDYLETLSAGDHTLTATFDDGTADATFTVQAKSPVAKTGDNGSPWGVVALAGLAVLGAAVLRRRSEER